MSLSERQPALFLPVFQGWFSSLPGESQSFPISLNKFLFLLKSARISFCCFQPTTITGIVWCQQGSDIWLVCAAKQVAAKHADTPGGAGLPWQPAS